MHLSSTKYGTSGPPRWNEPSGSFDREIVSTGFINIGRLVKGNILKDYGCHSVWKESIYSVRGVCYCRVIYLTLSKSSTFYNLQPLEITSLWLLVWKSRCKQRVRVKQLYICLPNLLSLKLCYSLFDRSICICTIVFILRKNIFKSSTKRFW